MKLIAQVKLQTTPEQFVALEKTVRRVNEACNHISGVSWKSKVFGQFHVHKLVYRDVRNRFHLTAQLVVRAIAKVADAYKLDKNTKRVFKPLGAITYDDRILSWKSATVSIATLTGRLAIPFVCGEKQRELLKSRQGESDLILFRGNFYLSATCNIEEPVPAEGEGVLGIDMGVVNIAVSSDGEVFSSRTVNNVRHRHIRQRAKLQSAGTKSAKRHLKKLSGKESRFAKHTNHSISKAIVKTAKDTNRSIAVEDLTGIRTRTRFRKAQRSTMSSWSFFQLRSFLEYKSKLAGVKLVAVDPRNTSRTCAACGCVDKANRPSQSSFKCITCGYSGLADYVAARIIASRAAVNPPIVSTTGFSPSPLGESSVVSGTSYLL